MPTLEEVFVDVDHGPLIVIPTARRSVALQVTTPYTTSERSVRFPRITQDPTAAWVAEDEEIDASDMAADEDSVTPAKVAGLVRLSNEAIDDTNPSSSGLVGDGLARVLATKIDAAFFGSAPAAGSVQPRGLEAVVPTATVAADPTSGTEPYIDAIAAAEAANSTLSAFVTTPDVAKALAKLKTSTGSNLPLFGTDATNGINRQILGVPLLVSASVQAGTVWGIPSTNVYTVIRRDVTVVTDTSRYLEYDQTALRGIMRVGFGFPYLAPIQKIKAS